VLINHLHFCNFEASTPNIGSCVSFGWMRLPLLDPAWNSGSGRCCPIFCSTILTASSPSMAEIVRIYNFFRVPLRNRSILRVWRWGWKLSWWWWTSSLVVTLGLVKILSCTSWVYAHCVQEGCGWTATLLPHVGCSEAAQNAIVQDFLN